MKKLPETGFTKTVGVYNFSINHLKEAFASPGFMIVPACNQVEIHPLLPQEELVDFCKEKCIIVEAYYPFGSDNTLILANPIVQETAKKSSVDIGQLLIPWSVQREICPLPKSVKENRFISYLKTFELPEGGFKDISNLMSREISI